MACLLAGCSQTEIPQQERRYGLGTSLQERIMIARAEGYNTLSRGEFDRLARAKNRRNAQYAGLEWLGQTSGKPFAGYGFVGHGATAYAIYRDGTGMLFPHKKTGVRLEKLAPRLSRTFVAGPRRNYILGQSHRGTLASWNAVNRSQQNVLRPQQETFHQAWALDVAPLADSAMVAVAADGQRMEMWSLISGNIVRRLQLPDHIQPRTIMPDGTRGNVIFGTQNGEVRQWRGGRKTVPLYSHRGPVLAIRKVSEHVVASVGRGGQMIVFDHQQGIILHTASFPYAVYDLHAAPDGSSVTAIPAKGAPIVFDLYKGKARKLKASATNRFQKGAYARHGALFIARELNGRLIVWDVKSGRRKAALRPAGRIPAKRAVLAASSHGEVKENKIRARKYANNDVVDYAVSDERNMLVVASDGQISCYSLKTLSQTSVPLITDELVVGIDLSTSGRHLLVALANGTLVRMHAGPTPATDINMGTL